MSDSSTTVSEIKSDPTGQEHRSSDGGRLRWLLDPEKGRILLPASGLWILALDWLLFSSNALTLGLATPIVSTIGCVLGGMGVFFLQRRFGKVNAVKSALKALVSAAVVGAPLPLTGTIVGAGVLLFSGLGKAKSEVLGS
jgi:hypothetical protein